MRISISSMRVPICERTGGDRRYVWCTRKSGLDFRARAPRRVACQQLQLFAPSCDYILYLLYTRPIHCPHESGFFVVVVVLRVCDSRLCYPHQAIIHLVVGEDNAYFDVKIMCQHDNDVGISSLTFQCSPVSAACAHMRCL